jgi:hypothetical protein
MWDVDLEVICTARIFEQGLNEDKVRKVTGLS